MALILRQLKCVRSVIYARFSLMSTYCAPCCIVLKLAIEVHCHQQVLFHCFSQCFAIMEVVSYRESKGVTVLSSCGTHPIHRLYGYGKMKMHGFKYFIIIAQENEIL